MAIARVNSFAFSGIEAQRVQVQISAGLPGFLMLDHITQLVYWLDLACVSGER
jgi:hypothetical protein